MISAESRKGRRIVGSLSLGADLFAELRTLCRQHNIRAGELRATGTLKQAELCSYDQHRKQWKPRRAVEGGLELLNLTGNISEENGVTSFVIRTTLMRDRDTGIELIGGLLTAATVFSVEVVIEAFDDLLLRRRPDTATGLQLWSEILTDRQDPEDPPPPHDVDEPQQPVAAQESVPVPDPVASPDPVAVQDAAQQEPATAVAKPTAVSVLGDDDGLKAADEVNLSAGDVIVHPRFRRCVVQRIEGYNDFVHVQLGNGRVVRLSLEIIRLRPKGTENGQRIFDAVIEQ